jgi:hypothetical protein
MAATGQRTRSSRWRFASADPGLGRFRPTAGTTMPTAATAPGRWAARSATDATVRTATKVPRTGRCVTARRVLKLATTVR